MWTTQTQPHWRRFRSAKKHPALVYSEGFNYRKGGVRLHSLSPADQLALRMFGDERAERFRQVMLAVDGTNRRWGKGTVRFAVANPGGRWGTKFGKRSPRYTTRLREVFTLE